MSRVLLKEQPIYFRFDVDGRLHKALPCENPHDSTHIGLYVLWDDSRHQWVGAPQKEIEVSGVWKRTPELALDAWLDNYGKGLNDIRWKWNMVCKVAVERMPELEDKLMRFAVVHRLIVPVAIEHKPVIPKVTNDSEPF